MKLSETEEKILDALAGCRFLPGSFEKKLAHQLDRNNVSPRQQWYLHKYCIKYRKQIDNYRLLIHSKIFIANNPFPPLKRRDAERMINKALKEKKEIKLPPTPPTQEQLSF